jgi:hypothetical protein
MGGANRDVQFSAYADVSDVTSHKKRGGPDELQIDTYFVESGLFDETGFEEGRLPYEEYSAQRHRDQLILASDDTELPEIYTLAERFVQSYPITAATSDILKRKDRRRLRRELEQRIDDDMNRDAYNTAVDAALDTITLSDAINMDAFRDRVAIEISTVYNIPVKDG